MAASMLCFFLCACAFSRAYLPFSLSTVRCGFVSAHVVVGLWGVGVSMALDACEHTPQTMFEYAPLSVRLAPRADHAPKLLGKNRCVCSNDFSCPWTAYPEAHLVLTPLTDART